MHFTTRSFLGHTDPNSYSQFWENEPDNTDKGHLFGLINLTLNEDEDASAVGHDLINEINLQYFQTADLKSLEAIAARYLALCSSFTLLLAVNKNGRLSLFSYNSGQMLYRRGTQLSNILKSYNSKIQLINGQVQDGDQLLLETYPFSQGYTFEKIKSILRNTNLQDIEESFLSELYTLPDQSHLAAALIVFHQDAPDATVETPTLPIQPSPEIAPPPQPPKISLLKKIFTTRPTFISHHDSTNLIRKRRLNIIFSLLILSILGASVFFGYQRNQRSQSEQKYAAFRHDYDLKIQNANAVKNINLSDSQKLAKEAGEILKKMAALKIHADEVSSLQKNTSNLLSETGSSDTYEPIKFFDTTLIYNDAKYSQLYLFKNNLYLFDNTNGRVDKINITNKSKQNIASNNNLKGATNIAIDNDTVFVEKDQQVYQLSNSEFTSKIKLPTPGQISFWNGSLYLLSDTITKFTPNSKGFDSGSVWLKSNESLPARPTSLAINGQIWVMSATGEIVPYTHGARTNFKMNSGTFTQASNLVTALDSEVLAFTDKDNLIYVYKKTGESLFNYNYGSKKILSLALDSASNTLFVLCTDSQIYKISL